MGIVFRPFAKAVPDSCSVVEEFPAFCMVVVWFTPRLVELAARVPYLIEEVVTLIAVSTFTFTALEVAVVVPPVPFVTVIAPVHESAGKLDDVFPVDCAKYQISAEQLTVLVLPLKMHFGLAIW